MAPRLPNKPGWGTCSLRNGLLRRRLFRDVARLLKRHPALVVVTWLSMVAGVLFLGLLAAGTHRLRLPDLTHSGWASVLFLGRSVPRWASTLWLWALQRLTPTKTAVFLTLNPIAATLLSVGLLGERVGPGFLLGLVLVLAGIVVANRPARAAQ